ncbi:MAG: MATE family efflux transporter [Bacillota bacterium]|nr:MATE family efflux transporter [Bacillota bacterium]
MTATDDFSRGSVNRHILRLAVPMTLAQLCNILYNIVDRIFIGHIESGSSLALTGLGVVFPLLSIIAAFANLAGQGGAVHFAIARGRGDDATAGRIMGNALALILGFALILMLISYAAMEPLLRAFGASDASLPYARDYLRIYLLGTPASMIALGMVPFINAQGAARAAMISVAIGALLNTVLDPLFIFVFGMGVQGAALASVLSQLVAAAFVLRCLTGSRLPLSLTAEQLRPDPALLRPIVTLGLANFTFQITNSAVAVVSNTMLLRYGGDVHVAILTVLASIRQVISMPSGAVNTATQPVMSYNYGAKKPGRVLAGIRFNLLAGGLYNLVFQLLILAFPAAFLGLFSSDPELIRLGVTDTRIYFAGFAFMALQFAGQSTFLALGMARHAIFFSLLRKAILVIPLTLLLPGICGFGVHGVYLAECASQYLGASTCFLTMRLGVGRRLQAEAAAEAEASAEAEAVT